MRYRELDFIRGLCLLDMVIVHLIIVIPAAYFDSLVQMTNFAAEGFFLLAGMMIGIISYPRYLNKRKQAVSLAAGRASGLLIIHVATIAAFGIIYHLMGIHTIDSLATLGSVVMSIIRFEKVYHLTNILWLFVLFFLISPVFMRVYEKWGAWGVFSLSAPLLAISFSSPHTLFISYPDFPILSWQFVFASGFVLGIKYTGWKDKRLPSWAFISLAGLFAVLFSLRFQAFLGFSLFAEWSDLFFKKFPLNPGLLLYVAILLVFIFRAVHRYHHAIPGHVKRAIEYLGRYSLVGFIAHMYLDFFIHKINEAVMLSWISKSALIAIEIVLIFSAIWASEKVMHTSKRYMEIRKKG